METIRAAYEKVVEGEAKIIACKSELDALGLAIRTWALDDQVDVPGGIVEKKKRQLELYDLMPKLRELLHTAKVRLGSLVPSCGFHGPYNIFKTSTGWIAKCDRCIAEESGSDGKMNEKITKDIIIESKLVVAKAIAGKDEPFLEPELRKLVLMGASDEVLEKYIIATTLPPFYYTATLGLTRVKK
jgi:hypothetical protein